ncbi:MAG: cysteine desulfurase CsdA, partial [Gammaproteobacteria bacterium]|nr:cysteine desulfurase CsdA [Gammaproteobacteria bacterium]
VGGSTWSMQYHVEIELIAHEQDVLAYASRSLGQIDGFEFIGTAKGQGRSHILNLKKVHPFDVGAILD